MIGRQKISFLLSSPLLNNKSSMLRLSSAVERVPVKHYVPGSIPGAGALNSYFPT